MDYQLTLIDHPAYLHARGTGPRTADNALRFLKEAYDACRARGQSALLVETAFSGPSLSTADIFRVITERSTDGAKLRKIAYVDSSGRAPDAAQFAETVAINRAVNVRLFPDLMEAAAWLLDPAD